MDTRLALGRICWKPDSKNRSGHSFSFAPSCSRKDPPPRPSGENSDGSEKSGGDKFSTDWDKAWTKFKKQGKKSMFSQANKYVSWNPRRSDFPLSEEVDPIKRAERSNLKFWNSPTFSLGGAIIIVLFLLLYTLSAPIPK